MFQVNQCTRAIVAPVDLPNTRLLLVHAEADSSEVVTAEIREFIEGLRVRKFLTPSQAALLSSLLDSNRYVHAREGGSGSWLAFLLSDTYSPVFFALHSR